MQHSRCCLYVAAACSQWLCTCTYETALFSFTHPLLLLVLWVSVPRTFLPHNFLLFFSHCLYVARFQKGETGKLLAAPTSTWHAAWTQVTFAHNCRGRKEEGEEAADDVGASLPFPSCTTLLPLRKFLPPPLPPFSWQERQRYSQRKRRLQYFF